MLSTKYQTNRKETPASRREGYFAKDHFVMSYWVEYLKILALRKLWNGSPKV